MLTGPEGPVQVFLFYWPEVVLGDFYWPGACSSLLGSNSDSTT